MTKIILLCVLLAMVSCAPLARLHRETLPIMYDNTTVSVVTDNVLLFPQMSDKEFMKILSSRLNDATKAEIAKQGRLKVISACGPKTLKIVQEITGITVNTVTDVSTGFFLFQLFRGSATSTKSDNFSINTTTTVIDCESSKTLGVQNYQYDGQNPIESLQAIAWYNVWYAYTHQRGPI
jgi:hypothetical protein